MRVKNTLTQKKLFGFSRPLGELLEFSEHKPMHVFAKTLDGMILSANALQAQYLGCAKASEIVGKNYKEFPIEMDAKSIYCNDFQAISSHMVRFFIEQIFHPHTDFFNLKTQAKDSSNNVVGVAGISFCQQDVTLLDITEVLNQLHLPVFTSATINFSYINISNGLSLSNREKECAFHILKGLSAKEISKVMGISYRTVESHIANIKEKLHCKTRSQIIARLMEV